MTYDSGSSPVPYQPHQQPHQMPYPHSNQQHVRPWQLDQPVVVPMIGPQQRSHGAAVALELVPGLFGIFGIGSLYAGRTAQGVVFMVSFWFLFWINFALTFLVIGWITMPLTWIGYLVLGVVSATRAVEEHNRSLFCR